MRHTTDSHDWIRLGALLAVVLVTVSAPAVAAHSGSLSADPMESGELSTHTMTVTVEERSAGSWSGIELDYSDTGANPSGVTESGVATIGIDRDDDASGQEIDVDVSEDLTGVTAEETGRLAIQLDGSHSIEAGDELVVRIQRSIQNPASEGDYEIPIDVNPSVGGGQTTARLQIGTNRATILVDDQSTTGEMVTVDSVSLPDGGFVVLHERGTLDNGATNADAVTGQSVVGTSAYLDAGSHQDVTVEVSGELSGDATYVAMASKDGDGNQAFEASADRPYTVGGNPIWEAASLTLRESTSTPTATATPTPEPSTETPMDTETEPPVTETATPASSPGFGALVALLSLLGSIALARRRVD